MSVSKQFLVLLSVTFSLAVAFVIGLAYEFAKYSVEGAHATQNLKETFALNQELRVGINDQINMLHRQFEKPDPAFPASFSRINYELGQKETQYLKLDLGENERLTVERIKGLHAELGVQAIQIFETLLSGDRDQALNKISSVEELENRIDREFISLNDLQVRNLESALDRLNSSLSRGYIAIYTFAGSLVLTLVAFTLLLRRRVFRPLGSILAASNEIRRGNFGARTSSSRPDEIGHLAQSFNFMAESLAESYASLEQKVEERTRRLQELQQQLVQAAKMSSMGRLVSGVAHELNNPLAVIMGYTELAKGRLEAKNADPAEIKLMAQLHFQAERCGKIVASLLQFARQGRPHLEIVRINSLVEQILQLREYELRSKNVDIVREYDPSNPTLCADPDKLQQVVLNLLNNAYDAIQEAGGPGTIWVRTGASGGRVSLEFLDNGTGIQEPERVFDPFYTTKAVGQGTGLGLSVCYGIIEEHNGEIHAGNWERGARFIVMLPVGDTASLQDPLTQPLSRGGPDRCCQALVIDDEQSLLELQISFLRAMGLDGVGLRSGEEAVSFLQNNPVDIIISDIRMPGAVDGVELYQWVRENRPELSKRFLFVSGDLVGMNTGPFFSESTAPRIQKPFKFESYSRIVRQILDH